MTYHNSARALELLRQGMARHGCATARELAAKLGLPYGPRVLTAIGYRGNAQAAWQELAPDLEDGRARSASGDEAATEGR